ncbi:hypothetical protein [Paractinoplanes brasiliensis]|uniref:Uncharacterized protein n=2 Tax=Paractinoplanes brasiliensis TaxID=52695 RepID=A0A4R6K324_9ACTN|nr:hypothetical protein [Actinoplanes brasiliensis]TDO41595.1 hypothetical protein C8E87_5331 [Actinoplanes brasiliensis]
MGGSSAGLRAAATRLPATAGRAANGTGGLTRLELRLPRNGLGARKLPVLPRHLLGVVLRRTRHTLRARELPVFAGRPAIDILRRRDRPGRWTPIRVLRRLPGSHRPARRTPIWVLQRRAGCRRPGRWTPVRVLWRLPRRHRPGRWNLTRRNGARPGSAAPRLTRPHLTRPQLTRPQLTLTQLTLTRLTLTRLTRSHLARPCLTRPQLALTRLTRSHLARPCLTRPQLALTRLSRPGRLSAAGRDAAGTVTGPRNHSRGLPGHGSGSPGNRRGPHTLASRHDRRHNGGRPHRPGARNRRGEAARVPGHPRPAPACRRVGTRLIALRTSWGAGLRTVTHGAGALRPFRSRYGSAALAGTTVPGNVLTCATRPGAIASPGSAAALSCFAAAVASGALARSVLARAAVPPGGLARSVLAAAAVPTGGLLRPGITRPAARERLLTGRARDRPPGTGTTEVSPARRTRHRPTARTTKVSPAGHTGDRAPAERGAARHGTPGTRAVEIWATRHGTPGTRVVETWATRHGTPGTCAVEARGTRNRARRSRGGPSRPEIAVAGARDRVRAVAAETVAAAHGATGGHRA